MDNFIRFVAAILAVAGFLWGVFCLFFVFASPFAILIFGPGYAVTAGYFIRCIAKPTYKVRILIWVSSIVVQGAWFVSCFVGSNFDLPDFAFGWVIWIWWLFSLTMSSICLCAEISLRNSVNKNPKLDG